MNHSIKVRRATTKAGYLPQVTKHILGNIPESAIDALTSRQLTELMQAMHKHFMDGKAAAEKEIAEYLCLPNGVSIWAVLGDANYLGIGRFSDGLNIPDVLERRAREIQKIEAKCTKKAEA